MYKMIKNRLTSYFIPATPDSGRQNITRDIEVKNNLTMVRAVWGGDSEERGLQVLL